MYSRQPAKAIYLACSWFFVLFLVPYWIVISFFSIQCPSSWSFAHFIRVKLYSLRFKIALETSVDSWIIDPNRVGETTAEVGQVWIEPDERLIVGEIKRVAVLNRVSVAEVAGYWYGSRDVDGKAGRSAGPEEKVIYLIHGTLFLYKHFLYDDCLHAHRRGLGSKCALKSFGRLLNRRFNQIGSAHPSWMDGYLANKMLQYAKGYSRVFQIEYRLSQLHSPPPAGGAFPTALIDVVMGYNYLINTLGFKPSNIVVAGDSAGANLALALVRYSITAAISTIPSPRALFLHSPGCDWGLTHLGADSSMVRNSRTDYVQAFLNTDYCISAYLGVLPRLEASTNPWISPASLGLTKGPGYVGFPPTLMISGDAEMLIDSIRTLRMYMTDDMGEENVTYMEITDGTHVVMSCNFLDRENTQAYEYFAQWLRNVDDI